MKFTNQILVDSSFSPVDSDVVSGDTVTQALSKLQGQIDIMPIGGAMLIGIQKFTATGTSTYTPTAGTKSILVYALGGGGAGGGVLANSTKSCGTGGGCGGTRVAVFNNIDTTTGTVVVGTKGNGGTGTGGSGSASTFTYKEVTITGNGGSGGISVQSTDWFFAVNPTPAGGSGGATGAFTIYGNRGNNPLVTNATNTLLSGEGGGTWAGYGGAAGFSTSASGNGGVNAPANSGAGGGGAYQSNNTSKIGGDGGSGVVIIFEYK